MEKKIIWHLRALKQLKNVHDFIATDSLDNAEKVIEKILQKIDQVALNPEIYPLDKYKKSNNNRYRAFTVYHFRISYYVQETKITIVRIRHTSMSPLMY